MGRKNKSYSKDLKQQIHDKLVEMLKNGEGTGKREAILNGTDREKIFSYNTFQTYWKHCKYFANYILQQHPECTTLKAARKYVNEWLQLRTDQVDKNGKHLSAWTIQTEAKALGKLYGIQPDDPNYFQAPHRRREDIFRSRGDAVRDRHFSEKNNDEFIKFCKGTGCRRNVLEKLEGRDLFTKSDIEQKISELEADTSSSAITLIHLNELKEAIEHFPDQEYFIHHRTDKGGRERYSPVIGKNRDKIVERMRATAPYEKVWQYVPGNADIHSYRGEYATAIYKMYARPVENIPYDKINKGTGKKFQSGVYVCRKDEAGKKLDKDAMMRASKALGHNRLEVVANNYIRGL